MKANAHACTAAPQLCTLCEHAVLANLVNPIGWFSQIEEPVPLSGRGFANQTGGSLGGADHGLE